MKKGMIQCICQRLIVIFLHRVCICQYCFGHGSFGGERVVRLGISKFNASTFPARVAFCTNLTSMVLD